MPDRRRRGVRRRWALAALTLVLVGQASLARGQTQWPGVQPPDASGPLPANGGLFQSTSAVTRSYASWTASAEGAGAVSLSLGRLGGPPPFTRRFRLPAGYSLAPNAPGLAVGDTWETMAWAGSRAGRFRVWAVRCSPVACGRVRAIYAGGGGAAGQPLVAAVGRRALLLWLGAGAPGRRPALWSLEGAKGPYGRVHAIAGASGTTPDLVPAGPGRAAAAWLAGGRAVTIAEFARAHFGRAIRVPAGRGAEPRLAASGREVVVVWRGGPPRSAGGPVRLAVQDVASGRFTASQTVFASAHEVSVAAAQDGPVVVGYVGSATGALMASICDTGGGCGAPQTVAAPGRWRADSGYTVTADDSGGAGVEWADDAGHLYFASRQLSHELGNTFYPAEQVG